MKKLAPIRLLSVVLAAMLATAFGVPGACAMCCEQGHAEAATAADHSCCSTEAEPVALDAVEDSCCSTPAAPATEDEQSGCATCAHCQDTDTEERPLIPSSTVQSQSSIVLVAVVPAADFDTVAPVHARTAHDAIPQAQRNILHCVYRC